MKKRLPTLRLPGRVASRAYRAARSFLMLETTGLSYSGYLTQFTALAVRTSLVRGVRHPPVYNLYLDLPYRLVGSRTGCAQRSHGTRPTVGVLTTDLFHALPLELYLGSMTAAALTVTRRP